MSKLPELTCIAGDLKPQLILITESWLKPVIPDSVCSLPGYTVFRADHPDGRGYGGVCIFVEDVIASSFKIERFSLRTPGIDNLFLKVGMFDCSLTFGCVYRPRACASDAVFLSELERLLAST